MEVVCLLTVESAIDPVVLRASYAALIVVPKHWHGSMVAIPIVHSSDRK